VLLSPLTLLKGIGPLVLPASHSPLEKKTSAGKQIPLRSFQAPRTAACAIALIAHYFMVG
jgi:hypothetical protein